MLGNQNDPARFTIQTVDERDLTSTGYFIGKKFLQMIPEGDRAIRLARMDKKEWRLLNGEKIGCFSQNGEGNLFQHP
jgi:hypothetical protein